MKKTEKRVLTPKPVRLGIYKHYGGGTYEVLGTVHHSETEEQMVHYKQLDRDTGFWVRPYDMFHEHVEIDGKLVPRFEFVGDALK